MNKEQKFNHTKSNKARRKARVVRRKKQAVKPERSITGTVLCRHAARRARRIKK